MTSLNPSLRLALLQKAKGKKNIFQKGFTLVELMTVIVIVGVLSAVALPSFLSQAGKAKGTEAKAQISSIMKDAAAVYQQGQEEQVLLVMGGANAAAGTTYTCEGFGAPPDLNAAKDNTKTVFDYACSLDANDVLKVIATGNAIDSSLKDNKVSMSIDLPAGTIDQLPTETSRLFGGTVANVAN